MTCIIGVEHQGEVFIGGDSAGLRGLDIETRKDPKVFTRVTSSLDSCPEKMAFGFSASFRMGPLLRYQLKIPPFDPQKHGDSDQYISTVFIEAVKKCFKDYDYTGEDRKVPDGAFSC